MVGATVLMASELELPENVCCIMADCPYSSPAGIIRKVCTDRKIPQKLAYPFIHLGALLLGRFRLDETTAEAAVRHSHIPILLLHGEDDRFVPVEMSRKIHDANPQMCRLITFPGAGHGLCYMISPGKYEHESVRFLWDVPALKPYLAGNSLVRQECDG